MRENYIFDKYTEESESGENIRLSEVRRAFSEYFLRGHRRRYDFWGIFEELYDIDYRSARIIRDVFSNNIENSCLENIDDLINGRVKLPEPDDSGEMMNTYPFGEKTDITYPRFFGVCRGKKTFTHFFEKVVLPQINRMKSLKESEKTALLILDKWSQQEFEKYEAELLNAAFQNNVWTVMLLVTGYGLVQIPFLPNDRRLTLRYFKNRNVIRDFPLNELSELQEEQIDNLTKLQGKQELCFYFHGGTWNLAHKEYLVINPASLDWEKTISGKIVATGTMNETQLNALYQDFRSVINLQDYHFKPIPNVLDTGTYGLKIFGKDFSWLDCDSYKHQHIIDELKKKVRYYLDNIATLTSSSQTLTMA